MLGRAVARIVIDKNQLPFGIREGCRHQGQQWSMFSRSFNVGMMMLSTVVTGREAALFGSALRTATSSVRCSRTARLVKATGREA